MANNNSEIPSVSSKISPKDHVAHLLFHLHLGRERLQVVPGLYALGTPTAGSPVIVTTNNMIKFDALRSALIGLDIYFLVLDTQGRDNWFMTGKSAFATDELIRRVKKSGLKDIVNHNKLILPELAESSFNDQLVNERCNFNLEYGPERAYDLPEYLETRQLTPEMQMVRYNLWERVGLIPTEFFNFLIPIALAFAFVYILGGLLPALATAVAIVAGILLFPLVLPWLPYKDFSTKGFTLGLLVTLPFSLAIVCRNPFEWISIITAIVLLIFLPPVTAFISLNFTGSTAFNKHSKIKEELVTYIPIHMILFGAGILMMLAIRIIIL
ncbi:MAG: hypothetical protein JW704_09095 [Anaerolineaceae bacterium]|nr:hypothetical protein [Anaerolineaceae bacterium]MBN2677463.1 hypothetical protein [Anaerolineaceae bacterium]